MDNKIYMMEKVALDKERELFKFRLVLAEIAELARDAQKVDGIQSRELDRANKILELCHNLGIY